MNEHKPSIEAYKFYLTILNAKLLWFYLSNTGTVLRGGYFRFKTKYLYPFPLPGVPSDPNPYIEKSELMMTLNQDLNKVLNKFRSYFSGQYNLSRLSRKLENWHELEFSEFIKELGKTLKKENGSALSRKEAFEWMDLFEENKRQARDIQEQIQSTDREIDRMVYDLYGLTADEIEVVER